MMAPMTQTQTPRAETPDPDPRPDRTGPDYARTQTQTPIETQTHIRPDRGSGPDATQTQTWTETRTRTPDPDRPGGAAIARHRAAGPGPDSGTQTQTAAQTRTRTPERVKAVRGWLGGGGYLTALTGVVGVVASLGQKEYAEQKAKFVHQIQLFGVDLSPWFAPFVFDLAVAALLHGGLRAARGRHSPWPWWFCGGIVAGVSTFTNYQHAGGRITGTASIGLFLIWGLYLLNEYKTIVRERETADSAADKLVSTDVLFTIDKPLAKRAWLIARTKPLAAGLAYRHRLGETQMTERDVAILAARIYNDVLADQLDVLMNPTAAAPAGDKKPAKPELPVRAWQRARRARAMRLATMTAGDAVDFYLGLPVPERHGVRVARVTYAEPDNTPLLGSVTAARVAASVPPAVPAAPAVPAVPAPASRRRITAAPAPAALPAPVDATVVVVTGQPAGNAGKNWMPLEEIPGLPEIDPAIVCECHKDPAKRCGKTLVEHVQRRGVYVRQIVTTVEGWDTRPERIGKALVGETCDLTSAGVMMEVSWLFDHLRRVAMANRAAGDAAATSAAVVPVAEIEGTAQPGAANE